MATISNGVKTYLESPSLLQYQPKIETSDDRNDEHSYSSCTIILYSFSK